MLTINPKWVNKEWTRKRPLLYALICFIIFSIAILVSKPGSDQPEASDDSKKVVQQETEDKKEEPKKDEPKKEEPKQKLLFDPKGPDRENCLRNLR